MKGGGIDVDQNLGAGNLGLCGGLGVPNVLANGQANRESIDIDNARFSPRSKVTLFVKNLIVGQALFVVVGQQFPC